MFSNFSRFSSNLAPFWVYDIKSCRMRPLRCVTHGHFTNTNAPFVTCDIRSDSNGTVLTLQTGLTSSMQACVHLMFLTQKRIHDWWTPTSLLAVRDGGVHREKWREPSSFVDKGGLPDPYYESVNCRLTYEVNTLDDGKPIDEAPRTWSDTSWFDPF